MAGADTAIRRNGSTYYTKRGDEVIGNQRDHQMATGRADQCLDVTTAAKSVFNKYVSLF